jgi:hypothetical protein
MTTDERDARDSVSIFLRGLVGVTLLAAGLVLLMALLCGCATARIDTERADGTRATMRVWVPAYPWQDVNQGIGRMTFSVKTNWTLGGLKAMETETSGATNLADLAERVVGAAVRAAVGAAK